MLGYPALKSQDEWFYDQNWTTDMELKLVDELQYMKAARLWVVGEENDEADGYVCEKLNTTLGLNKTDAFYSGKISFLKERYHIFHLIRKRERVYWNEATNVVQAMPGEFDSLVEEFGKPWTRAYENVGEQHFDLLKELFEYNPTPSPRVQWESSEDDIDTEDPYHSWDGRDI